MGDLQETIKNKVASYREDMIEYWKDLVNDQAGSKEGDLITALLKKVADRFTKEGFTATILDTGCTIPMLRATLGDDRPGKPILFCGHVDTVFPSGSYPDHPFRIEDGKVYGPGCADMKGGVVMLLYDIKILTDLGYKDHPFKVVLVGDEETTHVGSRADQMLTEEAEGCLCAFNMETGRMNHVLTVARKGCMDVWVKVHGKSGHVGNAYTTSANAIEAMAGIITKMRALTDLEKGRIVSTDVISGGMASNAVPDFCRIEADCRVDFNKDLEELKAAIRAICEHLDVPNTRAEVEFPTEMPVFEKTEGNLKLLALYNESAAEFGIEPFGPYHPGGCSDASYLAKAGIPILDSLGPEGDHAHTMQEYAVLESLFTRTAMLVRTILKLTDVTL